MSKCALDISGECEVTYKDWTKLGPDSMINGNKGVRSLVERVVSRKSDIVLRCFPTPVQRYTIVWASDYYITAFLSSFFCRTFLLAS